MSLYELVLVLRQDIATADIKKTVDKLHQVIEANEGEILHEQHWGLRTLAYPIRKNKKGHYIMLVARIVGERAMQETSRLIALSSEIIRHMIMKIKNFDSKSSTVIIEKEKERGEYAF